MKVGDEEALVTVSDGGYLAEYEGRDVPLEDFKFDLESLVGGLEDRFILSDVVLECSQVVMESDVGSVSVSGVLDGRVIEAGVWMSDGELGMTPVGSAGNVRKVDLIR